MPDPTSRLANIRDQMASAAKIARRDLGDVTLIAVTKTHSVDEIAPLIAAGQRDFGESRVQEAQAKWPDLRDCHPGIRLHLIGRLQSNKAAEAVALYRSISARRSRRAGSRLPICRRCLKRFARRHCRLLG